MAPNIPKERRRASYEVKADSDEDSGNTKGYHLLYPRCVHGASMWKHQWG
jgi:hypothetical protein